MPSSAKQYVDLAGITVYDEEIKNYIDQLDLGVTYTLSQDPNNPRRIILTPSEGTGSDVTIPTDAIYLTKAQYEALDPPVSGQLYGITDYNGAASEVIDDTITDIDMTWSSSKISKLNKITSVAVSTSSWSEDTTSQSGTTLYKKSISLSHVYVSSPKVEIGAGTGFVLPTTAEQESYNLLQYVTVDSAVPCLYLYASDIPTTAFYINVEGVD